jgi:hypothetical protein
MTLEAGDEMRDEIERLRTEVGQWGRACSSYVEVLAAQDADLKRLRGLLQVCMDRWIPFAETEFRQQVKEALGDE